MGRGVADATKSVKATRPAASATVARVTDSTKFSVVYRCFDPLWASMLADALRVEGITCHHVGTTNPALIDVGALACEQRLEVPEEDLERARLLIESSVAGAKPADEG
jgi:hypothetical protein